MNRPVRPLLLILALAGIAPLPFSAAVDVAAAELPAIPAISRRLPPVGKKLPPETRARLQQELSAVQQQLAQHAAHPLAADVAIYTDAVRLALRHDEFYSDKDPDRALTLLKNARQRLAALEEDKTPWTTQKGLVARGYRSAIDDSVQPYGLVIPEKLDLGKPAPLYVWLHGRGDANTNLTYITQRQSSVGQISPPDAIVLHPFGRHCVGFKSAGEIDILEAVDHVAAQYNIDRRRIVLMGFSMGGAGCWHVGAHYADRWVAMSPGAGFAETALYQNLKPADVPWYEATLWGAYDVPGYVRNLFNLPVVAYSGEIDKQKQAADVMEAAFAAEGRKLPHLIGPGMGHKYHPDTLAEILRQMKVARDKGLDPQPKLVTLQTRTLRYPRQFWVTATRLHQHWHDSRIDAERTAADALEITTRNVAALRLAPTDLPEQVTLRIDGQSITATPLKQDGQTVVALSKVGDAWKAMEPPAAGLHKKPGLSGPIDDAFLDPFLVVLPTGKCRHPQVERWVAFEQQHMLDRWQALFRGAARVKQDTEVTAEDAARYHLVLWGDPAANQVLKRLAGKLPIAWDESSIRVGERKFPAESHVPVCIYPNPESPGRYVVINSGPTFREGHDRTNSLQNPKLPDWAIVDLGELPSAGSPGKIADADFFDETWQLRPAR